jgi:hypothetical protein
MDTIDPGVTGRKKLSDRPKEGRPLGDRPQDGRPLGDRPEDGRPLAPARAVCKHFNIVSRTLSRWLANEEVDFPRPMIVNGRRYFVPREIEDFKERKRALACHDIGSARVAARQPNETSPEIAPKVDGASAHSRDKIAGKPRTRSRRGGAKDQAGASNEAA